MLRNGKSYASATSGSESHDEYIILSSTTLESTQHISNIPVPTDEEIVADSEIERLYDLIDVPDGDDRRMPVLTDAGDATPMPTNRVEVADALPAKDIHTYP